MVSDDEENDEFAYSEGELDDDDVDWEDVNTQQQDAEPLTSDPYASRATSVAQESAVNIDTILIHKNEKVSSDLQHVDWEQVNRSLAEQDAASVTRKRRRPPIRLTKYEKQRERALHQTHLLLLLAMRIKWMHVTRSQLLQGLMLSLTTTSNVDFFVDIKQQPLSYSLELILRWFNREFQVIDKMIDLEEDNFMTESSLINVFYLRKGCDYELTLLFAALCGALQLRYRLTCALDPLLVQRGKAFEATFKKRQNKGRRVRTFAESEKEKVEEKQEIKKDMDPENLDLAHRVYWLWCEVLDEKAEKWIHVDVIRRLVDRPQEIEALRGKAARFSYVVGIQDNNLLVDVTARYTVQWSKSFELRLADSWIKQVIEQYNEDTGLLQQSISSNEHDEKVALDKEKKELETFKLAEGMPTSLEGFRKHHLYVLERHLGQLEYLHPRKIVGLFNGQPVFLREHVQRLQSAFKWRRCGRVVKESERQNPAKWQSRNNDFGCGGNDSNDDNEGEKDKSSSLALFGIWQTTEIESPQLVNGLVPKNQYGNIEIWSPAHIPRNAVHLRLPRIETIAESLGIDFAPAVVGFEVRNGRPMPKVSGIVVAQSHESMLLDAHAERQQQTIEKAIAHNQKLAIKRWENLTKRLLLRQRLEDDYGSIPLNMSVLLLLLLMLVNNVRAIVTPDAVIDSTPASSDESIVYSEESTVSDVELKQNDLVTGDNVDNDAFSNVEHIKESEDPITDAELVDDDVDPLLDVPSGLFEVVDVDSVDNRKRQNYASLDAGATVLDAAPDTKSPTNLLVPDKDRYMLIPCSKARKWVVISLSEDVHADAIAIANYEKFSSPVKEFIVLGSVNYPTDTWLVLGNFTASDTNGEQIFQLDAQQHVRYIKFRFLSHYGSEYYCTLSQLRVFGRTFTQVISQLEKSIDAEVEALDAQTAASTPQLPTVSENTDNVMHRISEPADLLNQCLMEKNNIVVAIFYNATQRIKHYHNNGMCCLVDYSPKQIEAEITATSSNTDQLVTANIEAIAAEVGESSANQPSSSLSGITTNTTSSPAVNGPSADMTASSSSAFPASSVVPTSINLIGSSAQGLGRLESIFVRITKKIQALEGNQTVMARQIEEYHTQHWAAIKQLQFNQEAFRGQFQELNIMITDLKEYVAKELLTSEQALSSFKRLLDDNKRDNVALWNEMLIVREVIMTMKAGILCAIVLSTLIIFFYLFRLLLRCVLKCKERADLREWFWRMENHESSPISRGKNALANAMTAGSLHVNRNAQFGSSWDDSAIERKTLVSDMVGEGPHKFRRHRAKRASRSKN
ncbi:putative DNA repair protein Rad4 [Plasmopara halstedii]